MSGDPVKVASNVYRKVFENGSVRLLEANHDVGVKTPMHHHPRHLIYFLEGGRERFTFPDGKVKEGTTKAGDVIWEEEFSHTSENIGKTKVHALIIELK